MPFQKAAVADPAAVVAAVVVVAVVAAAEVAVEPLRVRAAVLRVKV